MILLFEQTVDGVHVHGPAIHADLAEESYQSWKEDICECGFTWAKRSAMDVENMVRDAFGRADEIFDNVLNEGDPPTMENNNAEA